MRSRVWEKNNDETAFRFTKRKGLGIDSLVILRGLTAATNNEAVQVLFLESMFHSKEECLMAIISTASRTIVDLTDDSVYSGVEPTKPVQGDLWLDVSETPPLLKRYSGEAWVITGADTTELENQTAKNAENITKITEYNTKISQNLTEISSSVSEVAKSVSDNNERIDTVESNLQQQAENVRLNFASKSEVNGISETLNNYFDFGSDGTLTIGSSQNSFTSAFSATKLAFKEDGHEVAYISNQELHIIRAIIENLLSVGNLQFKVSGDKAIRATWTN